MIVYLTARDLLSVCDMAEKLLTLDGVSWVTIVDCDSTYQPLLDRYASLPDGVEVAYENNLGPRAAWASLWREMDGLYAVSDGDLDISDWPKDAITRMADRLQSQPHLLKVGAALRIDDLPDTEIGRRATTHEAQFWTRRMGSGSPFFAADIDTTFAVYRQPCWGGYGPSERCGFAQARHLAWHLDMANLPDDWRHYLRRVDPNAGTHWSQMMANNNEVRI